MVVSYDFYSKENTVLRQARSTRTSRKVCCPRYSALFSANIFQIRKRLLNEEILKNLSSIYGDIFTS